MSAKTNTIIKEIIDSVVGKLCHDLINPAGTAQMALEQMETDNDSKLILEACLQQLICKLDIFRNIFRSNTNHAHSIDLITKYIQHNQINCKIATECTQNITFSALIFFLLQKLSSKSYMEVKANEIILEKVSLSNEEIKALEGKASNIHTGNIMPYIAQLITNNKFTIKQQNTETQGTTWKIIIE